MDFIALPACIERRYRQKRKKTTRALLDRIDVTGGSQCGSSDEDESNDMCSVFSADSQVARGSQENAEDEPTLFDVDFSDWSEDRVLEAMDLSVSAKNASVRQRSLQLLIKTFKEKYCIDFLMARPSTMADILERAIKKGRSEERTAAADLAAVLVLQYGASPQALEIYESVSTFFSTAILDKSVPLCVREKLIKSLTLMAFITQNDPYERMRIMQDLKYAFSGSFLYHDGGAPNVTAALASFHKTALLAWLLLLTICPERLSIVDDNMELISGLLESSNVDLRIAAGECLATMYEMARERDENFEGDDIDKLSGTLRMLASDSHRYRSRKDRKVQKASFRYIEKSINESEGPPDIDVSFGVETLEIRTWEDKRTYDAILGVLGAGTIHHLQFNPEVRSLFNLGDIIVKKKLTPKLSKFERQQFNTQSERDRFKRMGKKRDKRFDLMEEESD